MKSKNLPAAEAGILYRLVHTGPLLPKNDRHIF